jgi:hypothetical protein
MRSVKLLLYKPIEETLEEVLKKSDYHFPMLNDVGVNVQLSYRLHWITILTG